MRVAKRQEEGRLQLRFLRRCDPIAWFGDITSEPDLSQWQLNLGSIEMYALPDGYNGDQDLSVNVGTSSAKTASSRPVSRGRVLT